jgi:hypothetical protein
MFFQSCGSGVGSNFFTTFSKRLRGSAGVGVGLGVGVGVGVSGSASVRGKDWTRYRFGDGLATGFTTSLVWVCGWIINETVQAVTNDPIRMMIKRLTNFISAEGYPACC